MSSIGQTSIGQKVAKLRAEKGWTLKELSQKSGVSLSHISAIENETRPNPSILRVMKLAKAFGVSLAYFDDLPAADHSLQENEDGTQKTSAGASASWAVSDAVQTMAAKLQALYDAKTQAFIVSEASRPYVALAMQLAAENPTQDPSIFLQMIAQFIRDQKGPYESV